MEIHKVLWVLYSFSSTFTNIVYNSKWLFNLNRSSSSDVRCVAGFRTLWEKVKGHVWSEGSGGQTEFLGILRDLF